MIQKQPDFETFIRNLDQKQQQTRLTSFKTIMNQDCAAKQVQKSLKIRFDKEIKTSETER